MKVSRISALFGVAAALLAGNQAEAASFDFEISGTVASISNAGSSGAFLAVGDAFSTAFTADVDGNTISSVLGSVTFDGTTSDATGLSIFGGGINGDRRLRLFFEDQGPGLVNGAGTLIDDFEFLINIGASAPSLEAGLAGMPTFLSGQIVVSTVTSTSGSNARGLLGGTSFSVGESAAVPLPPAAILLLSALAGLGFVRRQKKATA